MDTQPRSRPHVVLHVGMSKTGTTTIQAWLHQNRDRLRNRGVLFPESLGQRRHTRLGLAVHPDEALQSLDWRTQDASTPSELRSIVEQQLLDEIRTAGVPRLLLSDEALAGKPKAAMENLRDLLGGLASSVRQVIYLRRQDDHLCSRYQQVVKWSGAVERLAERADAMASAPLYDYRARLEAWRRSLAPDELVVRRFEPAEFLGGSLHRDFLDATGLPVAFEELEDGPTRNESLDAESVEFLRLWNLHRRDGGVDPPGTPGPRRVLRRLTRASHGPTLTLPEDRRERFMARWEPSNRAVARDYFPAGSELLFDPARRSRNTTAEQYLDPDRLDHFFELLELPEELHAPLRAIAEREAAG